MVSGGLSPERTERRLIGAVCQAAPFRRAASGGARFGGGTRRVLSRSLSAARLASDVETRAFERRRAGCRPGGLPARGRQDERTGQSEKLAVSGRGQPLRKSSAQDISPRATGREMGSRRFGPVGLSAQSGRGGQRLATMIHISSP